MKHRLKLMKVLVVDDDSEILHMVTILLKEYGFNVCTYSTGINVPNIILKYKPDIILLDINLPGKSGTEVCKEIKQLSLIPVILFSANSNKLKLFEECKADAFIKKPFEVTHLVHTINLHLKKTA